MAAVPPEFEDDVGVLNAVKAGRLDRAGLNRVELDGIDVTEAPAYVALVRRHLIDVLGADRPRLTERGLAELSRLESR